MKVNSVKTTGPIKVNTNLIDTTTGEIFIRSEIINRDKNFTKIWIKNYIDVVQEDYSKIDLIPFLLIESMDKHNKIKSTLANLSKKFNYPKTKLSVAFKNLKSKDFLRKIQNGLYMINPNIAYKGTSEHRAIAINEYFGLSESKELIEEMERQKKIKQTKAKLKKLSPEKFHKVVPDETYDLIACTIVDQGGEIDE